MSVSMSVSMSASTSVATPLYDDPTSQLTELVHDLRSPLAAIEAAARAVLGLSEQAPAARRLIDLVAHEARCAQLMVDEALLGAAPAGEVPLRDVLDSVARRTSTRWGAPVHVHGAGSGLRLPEGATEVGRAVGNLVDNAFQHGHCAVVSIGAEVVSGWLVLTIIGADERGSVPEQPSHGLGLRSVRNLTRAWGGSHEVRTELGRRVDLLRLPLETRATLSIQSIEPARSA